jgi:PAS domain S-box-containing protein
MRVPLTSTAIDNPEWLTSMESVLEALNEGVVITDEHQQILSVSSRFIEMTGIPRQEPTGSYASQFYSAREWYFVAGQINAGSQQGQDRYTFILPRKDGGRLRRFRPWN